MNVESLEQQIRLAKERICGHKRVCRHRGSLCKMCILLAHDIFQLRRSIKLLSAPAENLDRDKRTDTLDSRTLIDDQKSTPRT